MFYEVDFCIPLEKGNFKTIHTELIASEGVTQCKEVADEIAGRLDEKDLRIFIGDFIE
ncbi:hypothetical protein [Halobacillus ihumii]|uniref:hypothetical protein n=1 Tax=Halobacillus ihumii TaxID=2686092 RepID=UPI0013D5B918|nr:hypothetical protein [Halobacillus ihumii]